MERRVPTFDKVIEIHEALKACIDCNGADGLVEYMDGQTDRSVAERIGVSPHSVQHLRQKMFGKLREQRAGPTELAQIRAQINSMLTMLADLDSRVCALEKQS